MSCQVFISFASRNLPIAEEVCDYLQSQAIRCWLAPRELVPGQNFAGEIIRAIRQARVLVVVFTKHANVSPHVMREVGRAVHYGLTVITLRVEGVQFSDDLEYYLAETHWLEASTAEWQKQLPKLQAAVATGMSCATRETIEDVPAETTASVLIESALNRQFGERIVVREKAAISLDGWTAKERAQIDALMSRRVLCRQKAARPGEADYVVFTDPARCRQAIAAWLAAQPESAAGPLVAAAGRFAPLANALGEHIRNQRVSAGRKLFEACLGVRGGANEAAGLQRIVESVASAVMDERDVDQVHSMVAQYGPPADWSGLLRAAQRQLNERPELGLAMLRSLYDRATSAVPSDKNGKLHSEVANEYGRALLRLYRHMESLAPLTWAAQQATAANEARLLAVVNINLARAMLGANPPSAELREQARQLLSTSAASLESLGDLREAGVACHHLGRALQETDEVFAERCFRKDVELSRQLKDDESLADALDTLGVFLTSHDRCQEAQQVHAEEVKIFSRLFDLDREARALANLARSFYRHSKANDDWHSLERARDCYERGCELLSMLDSPRDFAPALEGLGGVYWQLDEASKAITTLERSANQYERWTEGAAIAVEIRETVERMRDKLAASADGG